MRDYGQEKVLVVPWAKIPHWERVIPASQEILRLFKNSSLFVLRNKVEGDPSFKQIIPYCVLSYTDRKGITRLFHAQRRLEADRELGSKWTIGLGGHINPEDSSSRQFLKEEVNIVGLTLDDSFDATILSCAKRELDEEVEMIWDDVLEIKYLVISLSY